MLNLLFIGSKEKTILYNLVLKRIAGVKWIDNLDYDNKISIRNIKTISANFQDKVINDLYNRNSKEYDAIVIDTNLAKGEYFLKKLEDINKPILFNPYVFDNNKELDSLSRVNSNIVFASLWRFYPNIVEVKSFIDLGKLGNIGLIRIHKWSCGKLKKNKSNQLIALIDLVSWLFPHKMKSIYAMKSSLNDNYQQLHFVFEKNGMAIVDNTFSLPEDGEYFSLNVIGDKGAAYADDHHNINLMFNRFGSHAFRIEQGELNLLNQLQQFVNYLNNSHNSIIGLKEFRRILNFSEIIENSDSKKHISCDKRQVV